MMDVGIANISSTNLRELMANPIKGIKYSNIKSKNSLGRGFYIFPEKLNLDLIESTLPCVSQYNNHIQNLASIIFSFDFFGIGFNRKTRIELWKNMVLKKIVKKSYS